MNALDRQERLTRVIKVHTWVHSVKSKNCQHYLFIINDNFSSIDNQSLLGPSSIIRLTSEDFLLDDKDSLKRFLSLTCSSLKKILDTIDKKDYGDYTFSSFFHDFRKHSA